ncbi:hypothetical protein GWK47_000599 [Chionoecetes opilio]|uniref:Uncharacterized protein n=1 Tax=Chionoecetes opilio TaxID=41210 RepID=A0A8J5CXZ8_CHIOP|nr:hypothetical protein GWK47_000599 [Chionoecetes opilio]
MLFLLCSAKDTVLHVHLKPGEREQGELEAMGYRSNMALLRPSVAKLSLSMAQSSVVCGGLRMLPERFPYMPYAPRMLPEYFPNTHGRHIRMVDENYFEHAQQIFGATECRSVCIRTEPNSQCAPRTHRMLPEYDPFAPRTLKFLFGKQMEWHSAQCDRALTSSFT